MITLTDIVGAFALEYLERFPHLPVSHKKTLRAIRHWKTGHDGHSLSQCQSCAQQHRVNHSCGNRHCPQCQHHKTQQWLHQHRENQLPGPHFLITFTVPQALTSVIHSHQRLASQAMFKASSTALKRLAQDQRFIGTHLPGFPGILHTWGRQLPYHPHIPTIVPGGGLSNDRAAWLPSRANFFAPVKALSPIYRALCKEDMTNTGLLEHLDPQVWNSPWIVLSQATPHGPTAFTYLAPYVFKVAISTRRIVSRKARTVTFTSRQPRSARQRTAHLDAIEFLRRFLPHILPHGFMQVRHVGCINTRGAACGAHMQRVLCLWTSNRVLLDTG